MGLEKMRAENHSPSAAEMMDYVKELGKKIKFAEGLGDGWFVSGASNESGSNNPTITLSTNDKNNPHTRLTSRTIPWEEFKSWQE